MSLAVSGLPAGASAGFATNPVTVPPGSSASSTLTLSAVSSTPPGSYPVTLTGNSAATMHSSTVTLVVSNPPTTTLLTSSANPSLLGQAVTLTATVSAASGTPVGFLYFLDGNTVLARVLLSGGTATFTSSALARATHSLTGHFGGNLKFAPSTSAVLSQVVNGMASSTGLGINPSPSTYGQAVTLSATVSGAGATPSGSVTFKDGTKTLGTALLNGAGTAQLMTSATTLSAGAHTLTAAYAGDSVYTGSSTSAPLTVNPAATTTGLSSSVNPSTNATAVTFTATVSGPGTPLGFIYFRDGSTVLAKVSLSGGVATFTTSALAPGTHSVNAHYGGNANWATSTSATVLQTVN
ncbi:MAG: Ig-like domain-containing protein [Acidimicrobiales bacterium]